jgi:hypothetical protein
VIFPSSSVLLDFCLIAEGYHNPFWEFIGLNQPAEWNDRGYQTLGQVDNE